MQLAYGVWSFGEFQAKIVPLVAVVLRSFTGNATMCSVLFWQRTYPHLRACNVKVWALHVRHKNKIGNVVPMRARRKRTLAIEV